VALGADVAAWTTWSQIFEESPDFRDERPRNRESRLNQRAAVLRALIGWRRGGNPALLATLLAIHGAKFGIVGCVRTPAAHQGTLSEVRIASSDDQHGIRGDRVG